MEHNRKEHNITKAGKGEGTEHPVPVKERSK
jgi:hypothetical protein